MTCLRRHQGEVEVYRSNPFVAQQKEVGSTTLHSGRFTPGGSVDLGVGPDGTKSLAPSGTRSPRAVLPIASRYTNSATKLKKYDKIWNVR
jgi:hypothetical protein